MKKILLVIVLYNQKLYDCNTYRSLLANMTDFNLFIYDNSVINQSTSYELPANYVYIHDPNNPGLSQAYNTAADYAKKNNYEWIILLDQDTIFPENIILDYKKVIDNYPDIKMIAPALKVSGNKYMSPTAVKFHTSKLSDSVPTGITSLWKYSPVNSGLAINVNAFFEAGGYNNKVKLDFADYQFIERFRKKNDAFYVLKSVCRQEFSNEIQTKYQKLQRFELFCNSLKNCDKEGFSDRVSYFFAISRRMLSLIVKTGSLKPIKIFVTKYLL